MPDIGFPEVLLIVLIIVAIFVLLLLLPYWRIFRKAGFNPGLSLLMIVPLVNIIMLCVLAFSDYLGFRKTW